MALAKTQMKIGIYFILCAYKQRQGVHVCLMIVDYLIHTFGPKVVVKLGYKSILYNSRV